MTDKNNDGKTNIIQEVKYGNTKTYLIKNGSDSILIDTDWARTLPMFFRKIKSLGIKLSDALDRGIAIVGDLYPLYSVHAFESQDI